LLPNTNQLKSKTMRRILLLFSFVSLAFAGFSQGVTTSSIIGVVKEQSGTAIPGANIVATHEPSGTVYGTVSLADGRFNIPNMRVGGPYNVKITFIGYAEQQYANIFLKIGEPYVINLNMVEEGTQLQEIIVSGVQDRIMNSDRNGAVTTIGTREILTMPTISRSINDMTRMTPQSTSTSNGAIGGGNYRQNYITVDGSDFNNTFGIGTNLPANGSPISLDAIAEISVSITPYDIRNSGFIGSAVNAVTRSGTNDFSGSAYAFWRNQNNQGDQVANNDPLPTQPLSYNTYGFRLGGPIIKNKLFFFVNAETENSVRPGQTQFAATTQDPFGSSPNISRPTRTELDDISQFLRENYGYETGPYDNYDFEAQNTRFVARLDWNINQNHKFNIRYSQVESKDPRFISGSTTGTGFFYASGAGRTNNNALWFSNSNYFQEANFYSLAAELNSLFGNKFANTLRATYTNQNDPRSTNSTNFPLVDIMKDGSPFTSFGYEPFSFGNLRDVSSISIVDFVSWTTGKHNITAGVQLDIQNTKNGFQRFGTGLYRFNSWDDFVNGELPTDYAITYSLLPNFEQAFPTIKYVQYSAYAQDEFSVNEKLKITAGLRVDLPTFPSVPEIKTHPLAAGLTFAEGRKFDTGVLPEVRLLWSPRIGFNWDALGDRSLQVRGGTGIFTGRVPTVWLVSQSGDAGLLQLTQNFNGQANVPGPFQIAPYRPATPPAAGTTLPATMSAIDPEFRFPQTWKTSVAVDKRLPAGFIASIEAIYNKDINIAQGKNYNLVNPTNMSISDANGAYPDTRPIYPVNNNQKFINYLNNQGLPNVDNSNGTPGNSAFNPITLGNSDQGYYWSLTAKLDRQFSNGFSAFVAYTHSQSKVLYDGVGDQLFNTWSLTPIIGQANNPEMSYAGYVVPDRFVASVTYRKEYLKKLASSISLFYEGSIQGRFSYTYGADFNRDGVNGNDLIYVPKDPSEITFTNFTYSGVVYTAQQQSDLFFRYIEQDKYLSSRRGQYAERNGAKLPWRNQLDLRFAQDIFHDIGGKRNTLQFTVDIFNFGNMLNKSWGIFQSINAPAILVPTNQNAIVANGDIRPTFRLQTDRGMPATSTFRDNNSFNSVWYMQFGLRYTFN